MFQLGSFVNYSSVRDLTKKYSHHTSSSIIKLPEKPSKNLFNFKYVIGIGGFGKVWKVE